LVVGGRPKDDWFKIFDGIFEVDFALWDEITVTCFGAQSLVVELSASSYPIHDKQKEKRIFHPDILLIRSACFGVYGQNWKNALIGFYSANIPSVNTMESLYLCQEKPILHSYLRKVQKKLGKENFPLIPSTYYSSWKCLTFSDGFPLVAKIGTAHAGFGKMKILGQGEYEDLRSVVALQDRYISCEPFIEWDFDFRIQKIGNHYRAFRRYSDNWKGKSWNQTDEDIEVTPKFKEWIDAVAEELGMDICALDGVHSKKDDKEYILEINDSACGFVERHREEDLNHVAELVIMKMEEYLNQQLNETNESILQTKSTYTPLKKIIKEIELPQETKKEPNIIQYITLILGIIIGILSVILAKYFI